MTPEKKAEELIKKFMPMMYCYLGSGMLSNHYDEGVAKRNAVRCAVIAVDEVLEIVSSDDSILITELQYWQSVKSILTNKAEQSLT